VRTATVELETKDGPMALYEAVPERPRAAVVVIQEAFGVNDHISDVARRLAEAGYHAVAPHLFHRTGGGTVPYDDFSKVLPMFVGLDDEAILVDVDRTLEYLAESEFGWPSAKCGIVGYCMGGRVAFLVAARRDLGAAVTFYGGGIVTTRFPQFPALIDEAAGLKTPWLGLFGDKDESIPVEDVERIRSEIVAAPFKSEVVRYSDAGHGFHCDARASHYNADAAADGWSRTLAWFGEHLG
jgi:carboxymethylenebutenolidase